MTWLRLELEDSRNAFRPGETLAGTATWELEQPSPLELRLFWYTVGKGTEDVGVVETLPLPESAASGSYEFRLQLPRGPYAFSGKLISLIWALELVAASGEVERLDLTVAPTGKEIVLPEGPARP